MRLGEYQIESTAFATHQDVGIKYIESHKDFDDIHNVNDIAIAFLEKDVEFTGLN